MVTRTIGFVVMDLIPVKPLGDAEATIKQIYHAKLEPLYQRLKG